MKLDLEGRSVVVTGGSSGIGLACAERFAEEGARVVLVSRDRDRLDEAVKRFGSKNAIAHAADLGRPEARENLFRAFPDADVLVNNAGAIPGGSLSAVSMDAWIDAWQLKVFGYVHLTKLFLAAMRRRRSGCIVNIIGIAGRAPMSDYICGTAGNAALIAFTEAVGSESTRDDVRVCGINPGMTDTARVARMNLGGRAAGENSSSARWSENDLPMGRMASPDEIAAMAVFLSSSQASYLSGTVVDIDGGNRLR
ncbi:MAG: short-chain dehydrogenase/reductase [Mesorhizobium sp.]|nr:short-chain dehydrogenase/reductase [Mesorhizobium sp.]MCO5163684.1 short-chain dehydrogenase/reductase [Mesorhizobium sp.]